MLGDGEDQGHRSIRPQSSRHQTTPSGNSLQEKFLQALQDSPGLPLLAYNEGHAYLDTEKIRTQKETEQNAIPRCSQKQGHVCSLTISLAACTCCSCKNVLPPANKSLPTLQYQPEATWRSKMDALLSVKAKRQWDED